ncbi:hypothetical protein FPHOBKDP_00020 [Listeria phage LPJP1]|nr:hypothetical protein FPHOBKDP_00020 [Listeria phage LPJP1]
MKKFVQVLLVGVLLAVAVTIVTINVTESNNGTMQKELLPKVILNRQ